MSTSHKTSALVFLLLCICTLRVVAGGPATLVKKPRSITVVYYVHESFGGLNKSVETVAGPNNNLTTNGFGQVSAFDNPIKDGGEETSTVIGFAAGLSVATKHPREFHITVTHYLNSTILGQGTLGFSGKLDFNIPQSEVVVSGGTGDFKLLRGTATIEVVYSAFPFAAYKYTAKLVRY